MHLFSYTQILFFLFAALSCFCAYLAISQKNSIHALCNLIFVFVSTAFLMFFVNADFLAFSYIIVYVGAISIFFLFAVMLLDLKSDETMKQMVAYLPLHGLFIFANWLIFHFHIMKTPLPPVEEGLLLNAEDVLAANSMLLSEVQYNVQDYSTTMVQNDIMRLGHAIYVEFGIVTIILGGLLFLSMVGVICLTFEYAKSFTKRQYIYEQHAANHTIVIVS